jgi:Asp-tRNA(Asn)/Glu-tRNA(Gln) amidotransferase A subunit family amidase
VTAIGPYKRFTEAGMTSITRHTMPGSATSAELAVSKVCRLSAAEIAGRVRAGEHSAVEVPEAHIARIEDVNPKLNAVVVERYDAARAEAREIDRKRAAGDRPPALAGVPITVKECLDLAGTPSTFGLPSRANVVGQGDDPHVTRLRTAGAVVMGKTNVSQMLLYVESGKSVLRTDARSMVSRAYSGWLERR